MDIFYPEEIEKMPDSYKYEYFYKQANQLYETRYDPFKDEKEVEWYNNRLMYCIQECHKYFKAVRQEEKETLKLTEVMFITFSPRDDVPLKRSQQAVIDFCNKQKIKDYIYVIEQRGVTENEIHGIHYHILHTHTYDRASHYKRETKSSFRKYCDVENWQILNFVPCPKPVDIVNHISYMTGQKKEVIGSGKALKQAVDKIFRSKRLLKDYYSNDITRWEKYKNI